MCRFLAPSLLALCAVAGCDPGGARTAAAGQTEVAAPGASAIPDACEEADARPATGAPAEGVWLYDGGQHRVAAIVGPAQAVAEEARVTRRVETVEVGPGADTIRNASEAAGVRLQFIAPAGRPAAVYAVGPEVLLASYEPCAPGPHEPLIRYLRHDGAGRVATDVMLQREPTAP